VHAFSSGKGERFEYLLAPVLDEQKQTEATVCISRDITEQALAEEKIWHNAHHDLLTGLPNRRLFLDRLEQEVKHAKRANLSLAVLFLDLDGFKYVNDTLGHEAGDRVLQLVAERLTNCVREEDTVARLGGDEFTVILIGAEQQQDIEVVAQTIIDAIALPFDLEKKSVQISASIGISLFTENTLSAVAMLEAADHAMYSAKKSSTNRIYFYDT
jgi:diguanylate cyclase (GGDEF)-like protein